MDKDDKYKPVRYTKADEVKSMQNNKTCFGWIRCKDRVGRTITSSA